MTLQRFSLKYLKIFNKDCPYESFLEFIDSLDIRDWDELLAALIEKDDAPVVRDIVKPSPGIDNLTYLTRLLRQASPQASRLSGTALAAIVRRSLGSKPSKRREDFLTRALTFASKLDGGPPISVLEDVALDRAQQHRIRLQAAYSLADLNPESLDPASLGAEHIQALAPAILAAARGRNSAWLDLIFHLDVSIPENSGNSIEYPLGIALRDYEQINGTASSPW